MVDLQTAIDELNTGKIVFDSKHDDCCTTEGEVVILLERLADFEKINAEPDELMHGKWHIMPDDPQDESGAPTEEGWYRIITEDGEEMTDYFFGKPTLTGCGVAYWKTAKKVIRAWAKVFAKWKFEQLKKGGAE